MENLTAYCAPGTTATEQMLAVAPNVALRVITFNPPVVSPHPPVVFVAGWISLIIGWQEVLREMTRDFQVFYIETREKISSQVEGKADFSVTAIGKDVIQVISLLKLSAKNYILFGSSLGASAILDVCRFLTVPPRCLALIGPNAVFRMPKAGVVVIHLFPPPLYLLMKPFVKWYLKTFRLDIQSDYAQYQKYCHALDAADPWKLKKAALCLANYTLWDLLKDIHFPTLLIGASKDVLHEPENLQRMVALMPNATYLDLETNRLTHSPQMVEALRQYLKRL